MLKAIFSSLYPRVYINIVLGLDKMNIYAEVVSNKGIIDSEYIVFDGIVMQKHIERFFDKFIEASPYHYISLLDASSYQGAIGSCKEDEIAKVCDMPTILHKCRDNLSYYTSKYELKKLQDSLAPIELDFLFSPFSILCEFFKDKLDSKTTAFVLIEQRYLSFAVFDHKKLLFARHLDLNAHKKTLAKAKNPQSLDFGGINIDDISLDMEDNGFEHALTEIDMNSDLEDFDEHIDVKGDNEVEFSQENLADDYERFVLIRDTLEEFYNAPSSGSEFVESIYIASPLESTSSLKSYIEDELFLNVYVRKIDLVLSLCDLAKAEANAL